MSHARPAMTRQIVNFVNPRAVGPRTSHGGQGRETRRLPEGGCNGWNGP